MFTANSHFQSNPMWHTQVILVIRNVHSIFYAHVQSAHIPVVRRIKEWIGFAAEKSGPIQCILYVGIKKSAERRSHNPV